MTACTSNARDAHGWRVASRRRVPTEAVVVRVSPLAATTEREREYAGAPANIGQAAAVSPSVSWFELAPPRRDASRRDADADGPPEDADLISTCCAIVGQPVDDDTTGRCRNGKTFRVLRSRHRGGAMQRSADRSVSTPRRATRA